VRHLRQFGNASEQGHLTTQPPQNPLSPTHTAAVLRPNFHSAFPPRTFPTFGFSFAAFADELRFRIQTSGRCRSVQFSSSSVDISQLCFGWQSRKLRANAILPSAANVISGSVRFVRNNVTKRKHFVLGKRASIVWRIFRELLKCDKSQ